jgi:hypothetical protein
MKTHQQSGTLGAAEMEKLREGRRCSKKANVPNSIMWRTRRQVLIVAAGREIEGSFGHSTRIQKSWKKQKSTVKEHSPRRVDLRKLFEKGETFKVAE